MEWSAARSRRTSDLKSHKKLDHLICSFLRNDYIKLFTSLLLKLGRRPFFAPHLLSSTCILCRRHLWGRDIFTDRDADCHFIIRKLLEAGSNTSTVYLRVVGGDEKGSLESETVKYGHKSHGTLTRKWLRWRGWAAIVNDRPILSSERPPHIDKPATVWR
jgi:hypothetical protein